MAHSLGLTRVCVLALSIVVVLSSSAQGAEAQRESHSPSMNGFSSFAVDPLDKRVVYVSTGKGIFKSADAGASWRPVNDGLTDTYVFDIVIDQRNPRKVYAATNSGLFASVDAGVHWRPTGGPTVAVTVAIDPHNSDTLYVAGDYLGIFKSSDGGLSWRRLAHPANARFYALAIDPRHPSTVYAGAGDGVFKTVDGERFFLPSRILPTDTRLIHRWREGFVTSLAIDPRRPSILYLGCDYGVFKSAVSGLRWHRASTGIGLVGSLVLDQRHRRTLYAGTFGALFRTTDAGGHWQRVAFPDRGYILALALAPRDSNTIYAASSGGDQPGRAYKSSDGGRTWKRLSVPL
jgi:photosystem II stability/assembly factor-like uncharacterized protein